MQALAAVDRFDPEVRRWYELPPMLERRCSGAGVVYDGRVYMFGGICDCLTPTTATSGGSATSSAECWDPSAGAWRAVQPMAQARCLSATGVLADRVYTCGGLDGRMAWGTAEYFDPAAGTWLAAPEMPSPRFAACACVMTGFLYKGGGPLGCIN